MERMGLGFKPEVQRMQHERDGLPRNNTRLSMYLCVGLKRLTCHINHKWQVMLQRNSEKTATSEWAMVRRWRLGSKRVMMDHIVHVTMINRINRHGVSSSHRTPIVRVGSSRPSYV